MAAFLLLIFLISASFIFLLSHNQQKTLTADLEKNGILLAEILAYQARLGVYSENKIILQGPIESLFQHRHILEAAVYNLEGTQIAGRKRGETIPPAVRQPANTDTVTFIKQVTDTLSPVVDHLEDRALVWAPVMSGTGLKPEKSLLMEGPIEESKDRLLGFVHIEIDKTDLKKQQALVFYKTLIIGLSFLFVGAIVTYFLSTRITRPLEQLTDGVKRFGDEGACGNLPVAVRNEVGNLAKAFQEMADALLKREAEKKELEQHLWQTQKMEAIGTLAGGIAHDFNNILGIIGGYTELALVEAGKGSRGERCLKEVVRASSRARDLVQQILTFSRQSGNERKPLQLSLTVKEVMKMLRATLPSTIAIRYHISTGLPAVLADPIQIHQVLMNLCTNAHHAMQEKGGTLEVTLSEAVIDREKEVPKVNLPSGKYQLLRVQDTGHGIPVDLLERVFDPFFTTKGLGKGTGLGLSVVHGIVKNHDGAVAIKSNVGEGTTIDVYFPSLEETARDDSLEFVKLPEGTERILLVDDESAIVAMAQQMLESLGYQVTARTSSVEALAAFHATPEKYDLVITDMTMPSMTGIDLAREILAVRSDMPIILCTGFSETVQEDKAKALGIREFVMKPVARHELARIIRSVLS